MELVLRGKSEERDNFWFQMPVHYPRYSKKDYEEMPEWQLDRLLAQYGLPVTGDLNSKRSFAIGAFLWA
ncbi:cytoplasmic tRNA 2-thiolation protein [Rhynchospora pubera]|uniref:Cytoplasmic tRNA 2-thiolation protein n=1 Tax=Rhynchospora pubera TaxID=906938 RepID=A0AAV8HU32_9POAL|nr:cytoplasmic tRNA 2-thiolation protein [Rhynchospora pubera]KAJ4818402.1 cytoplasmic tRNA 2-thiolation protein [Rhynchospora pubera]